MSRDIWQEGQICVEHGKYRCDICAWIDELKERVAAEKERADKMRQYIKRMIEADDILFHEPIRWKDTGSKLLASLYPEEEEA